MTPPRKGTKGRSKGRKKSTKKGRRGLTESRKADHVMITLNEEVTASYNYWDDIQLVHNALPEVDKDEIDLSTELFGKKLKAPIIIAGMTGGYNEAREINANLARAAAELGIGMGVGSQRAALEDKALVDTFDVVKDYDVPLMLGNIGVPQVKKANVDYAKRAMKMVNADLLCIHLNFTQEIVQPEGDTKAKGSMAAIEGWAKKVPIIAKETGAGITKLVARDLAKTGVKGIDVGGLSGTSFSAVEVYRARNSNHRKHERLGNTFWNWGIPTPISVMEASIGVPLIATGGVRHGLDVTRAIVLGASAAGIARPLLRPAMDGIHSLLEELEIIIDELRAAMFLMGAEKISALRHQKAIITGPTGLWVEQLR
jgi:isopentenyl-diphosphate delta-isomerase